MDLSDAALRERGIEVLRACSLIPQNDSRPSVTDRAEVCVSDLLEAVAALSVLIRDAARAEADREATRRMQRGADMVLDAYKKHHEHFHSECSITGPGRLPDTGRTVK